MNIKKLTLFITASSLLGVLSPAVAAEPEDIIKYRISVMKSYGQHMAAASRIVRGRVDFPGHLKIHAANIAEISTMINVLFPEDSDFGDTRAKEEVWNKADDFKKAMEANQQAASAFDKTVAAGDKTALAGSFKKLSDSCKSCHEKFRTEEE